MQRKQRHQPSLGKPLDGRDASPVADSSPPAESSARPPDWLLRSTIYRRLPIARRGRLDAAILLRPPGLTTLEAIAERFNLQNEHGVTLPALRQYARRLEEWVRPAVTSQVMAAVLGCLPGSYRRKLVAGSEVLLLSRVVQSLSSPGSDSLSVAELAKLASLLSGLRPPRSSDRPKTPRRTRPADGSESGPSPSADDPASPNTEKLATAVRMLYGLPWPICAENKPQTHSCLDDSN